MGVKGRKREGRIEFPVDLGDAQNEGYCKSCQAPINWIRSVNMKNIPLDRETAVEVAPGDWWAESHFGHCPDADQHRRSG